jgi:hypothetical protein
MNLAVGTIGGIVWVFDGCLWRLAKNTETLAASSSLLYFEMPAVGIESVPSAVSGKASEASR